MIGKSIYFENWVYWPENVTSRPVGSRPVNDIARQLRARARFIAPSSNFLHVRLSIILKIKMHARARRIRIYGELAFYIIGGY